MHFVEDSSHGIKTIVDRPGLFRPRLRGSCIVRPEIFASGFEPADADGGAAEGGDDEGIVEGGG